MRKHITYILLLLAAGLYAQDEEQEVTQDFQQRTGISLRYKPLKNLTLSFDPELRLNEDFGVSKYHLETGLEYRLIKGLDLGTSYRFIINPRDEKDTEYLHRYAAWASYKYKILRFSPSVRLKYTNYSEEQSDGEFLRYRFRLKYDIKGLRITPDAGIEGFYNLGDAEMYKWRYSAGIKYKVNKHSSIGVSYGLDYYLQSYRNRHITELSFVYKF